MFWAEIWKISQFLSEKVSVFGGKIFSIFGNETRLFKYTENFTTKNWKFSDKKSDIFHISAQNRLWVLIRTALARQL